MRKFLIIGASEHYGSRMVNKHYKHSIIDKINLEELLLQNLISNIKYQELIKIYPDKKASIWGVSNGPNNKRDWETLKQNDCVLFYNQISKNLTLFPDQYKINSKMIIVDKFYSEKMSEYIWSDDSFSNIIFLNNKEELDINWEEFNKSNLPKFKNSSQKYLRNSYLYKEDYYINKINKIISNYYQDLKDDLKEVLNNINADSTQLIIDGILTKEALIKIRSEQSKLRKWVLETYKTKPGYCWCVLCEKELPEKLIKTSHLKPRNHQDTTDDERKDKNIVVPMCDLGCDRLYELGYIYIENDKTVHLNSNLNINMPIEEYYNSNFLKNNKPKVLKLLKRENMKYVEWKKTSIN